MDAQLSSEPAAESTWIVARTCQTCCPAIRQSDSVERALERRRRVSSVEDRWASTSEGLGSGFSRGNGRKCRGVHDRGTSFEGRRHRFTHLPSGFESWGRERGELGCDGEEAVEFAVGEGLCDCCGDLGQDSEGGRERIMSVYDLDRRLDLTARSIPRLAHLHICDSMVWTEGDGRGAVFVQLAAIEAKTLLKCFENETSFVDGRFWLSRHVGLVNASREDDWFATVDIDRLKCAGLTSALPRPRRDPHLTPRSSPFSTFSCF